MMTVVGNLASSTMSKYLSVTYFIQREPSQVSLAGYPARNEATQLK